MSDEQLADRLRSGEVWDEFCDALKSAGRIVLQRSPDSDLDRAEGYRYLSRLLRMGLKLSLEYADPAAPELIQYMDETQKFGVDNPDQLYQWARISAKYEYRLSGPRGSVGYIGIGVYAGSAGRGGRRTVTHINADELELGADGRLELILSAREYPGNWIRLDPDTTTMLVRQTMNDRTTEVTASLKLERLEHSGPPPPLEPARVAKGLARAARQVVGSATVFADLADRWAQRPNTLHPSDTRMAEESFGDPDLYYMGGYWKLAPDEALVLEFTPPKCRYWSFLLCNYWTESLEYRYRPIWTNKNRARYRADGSVKIAVAHVDPDLPDVTWIDTEGHAQGTMTLRWLLAEQTPLPSARVIKVAELAGESRP